MLWVVVPFSIPGLLLRDDERSVRLTTAKLFVAAADADPEAVVPMVPALAGRLAADEEFYYVRARSAEALEYVALGDPGRLAHQVQVSLSISTTTRNSSDITWVRHWYSSAVTLPRRSRRRVTRSQRDSPTRTHTSEAGPPRRWPCLHDRKLLTRCFPRANS